MRPAPFEQLRKCAVKGPVVVINISQYRSDAIIVTSDQHLRLVPLPNVTASIVESLTQDLMEAVTWSEEIDIANVLEQMWDKIVCPITDELDKIRTAMNKPDDDEKMRMWWCPTSSAWSLPLHAAGVYRRGGRAIYQQYTCSYTPTLSALLRSLESSTPNNDVVSNPRLLVVAQPDAPGEQKLPGVLREVDRIRLLFPRATYMIGEEGTRDNVLKALDNHAWVHFACHGHTGQSNPLESKFALHDQPLHVQDIIEKDLPHANLAVLSACHSAGGNRQTPDEGIHLAAGMQFAGFRSVVGTMWASTDEDGPIVAETFYKYMFKRKDRVDYTDAAAALAKATKELRKRKVPLRQWILYVHYGA
jgi:CHAT domain-containing protein